MQDVLYCLLVAETAYRVHDHSAAEVASFVDGLRQDFPSSLLTIESLQWSQPQVPHRYSCLPLQRMEPLCHLCHMHSSLTCLSSCVHSL